MHHTAYIIIPRNIYFTKNVYNYIEQLMAPYDCELVIEPYIEYTKEELNANFLEYKGDVDTIEKYCKMWNYRLDQEGNVISTYNKKGFYDYYLIGGRRASIYGCRLTKDSNLMMNTRTVKYLKEKYKVGQYLPEILFYEIDEDNYDDFFNDHIDDYVILIDYHN